MSGAQFRSQLSMWSILAAPLMISADLFKLGSASRAAASNAEVLAIDQDPAGVQGTLVSSSGEGQVWVKPLSDGSRAVALLNRGARASRIATSAGAIGMPPGGGYLLRDVWAHTTRSSGGSISANVGAYSTVLVRVSQTA
jgi:alpha-galactosidase